MAGSFLCSDSTMRADLNLRYNEIRCCLSGVDPYDVWSENVESEVYCSYKALNAGKRTVHVYPPWEYTFMYPFALMSRKTAGVIFWSLNWLSVILILTTAYRAGYRQRQKITHGLFVAACAMITGIALWAAIWIENFGLLIAAAILLMIRALEKRHDVFAGFCWAFIMVKPQFGILFAIPFLLKRKFLTITVAVAVCLLASIPPAIWCDSSPVDMMLHSMKSGSAHFGNAVLFPLMSYVGIGSIGLFLKLSVIIVIPICVILSWKLREASWHLFLCPTIVASLAWTIAREHDFNLYSIVLIPVGLSLLRANNIRRHLLEIGIMFSLSCSSIIHLHPKVPNCFISPDFQKLISKFGSDIIFSIYSIMPMVLFVFATFWLFNVAKKRDDELYSI